MVRYNRISPNINVARRISGRADFVVLPPVLGIDRLISQQRFNPTAAHDVNNLYLVGLNAKVRSGLSKMPPHSLGSDILGVFRYYDEYGTDRVIVASTHSIAAATPDVSGFSTMSDMALVAFSSTTTGFFNAVTVFDPAAADNLLIITNGQTPPKAISVRSNAFYDIASFLSVDSLARFVATADDRLIFFDSHSSADGQTPKRVRWSCRGAPLAFNSIEAGSGFEDLAGMRGVATGLAADRDLLLIFTSSEHWGGRPRRDAFAFDFYPISREIGCVNGATIAVTPAGVIWLSHGNRIFIHSNGATVEVGQRIKPLLDEELATVTTAFGFYEPDLDLYYLFYSTSPTSFPDRAVVLAVGSIAESPGPRWTKFTYPVAFRIGTAGASERLLADLTFPVLVSTSGQVYRQLSGQTTDDGTPIVGSITPKAIDAGRPSAPTEFWLDYTSNTTSYVSYYHGSDMIGATTLRSSSSATAAFTPVTAKAELHPQIRMDVPAGVEWSKLLIRANVYSGRY